MATTRAVRGRHEPRGGTGPFIETVAVAVAAVIGGGAVACGLVLAVRRLSGGFAVAESAVAWIVTAAGIALVAVADQSARCGGGVFGPVAARCGLVLGVAAVALPPRAGDWAAILAVMTAAAVGVLRPPRGPVPRWPSAGPPGSATNRRHVPRSPRSPEDPQAVAGPRLAEDPPFPEGHEGRPRRRRAALGQRPEPVPGRLLQRLERFESPSGVDCLRGRLQLSLPAGSRSAHAHVGFCPAFAETPSVRVTTEYDGVEAVVSAAEVLPWGVRVECRLTEPAEEPLEIPVDVFVQDSR